uniref:Uncharacterized protein n=1 Tax=Varanus komodoensis TaxID=61221 RepID=A0A8D2LYM9_VARKO
MPAAHQLKLSSCGLPSNPENRNHPKAFLPPPSKIFPSATFSDLFTLQTLKNPRVEKAEILEIAVGYLREMNSTKPQGAEFSEDQTLQTCYMMGFRECLLGLAAFIQQAHPSVQVHLLDTLHLYLASKPEPHNQDWTFAGFSPSPSLESPPRTPESFGSPLKTLSEPLRSPDPPCSSAGQLVSQQRDPHESTPKRMLPPVAFWRPWP